MLGWSGPVLLDWVQCGGFGFPADLAPHSRITHLPCIAIRVHIITHPPLIYTVLLILPDTLTIGTRLRIPTILNVSVIAVAFAHTKIVVGDCVPSVDWARANLWRLCRSVDTVPGVFFWSVDALAHLLPFGGTPVVQAHTELGVIFYLIS